MQSRFLNSDQSACADGFLQFMLSDAPAMVISGPGGVGKSHLIRYLIEDGMSAYQSVCTMLNIPTLVQGVKLLAATNKSANLLSSTRGGQACTLHKALGLGICHAVNLARINEGRATSISWMLVVIDECSRISSEMWEYIQRLVKNCKIVFVGDPCQLPPIGEDISPVYLAGYTEFELTTNMRAQTPALQEINSYLRECVKNETSPVIQIVPGVLEKIGVSELELEIKKNFEPLPHSNQILTFTRDRAMQFSEHFRFDATTVHMSQGCTYDAVFIDLTDIGTVPCSYLVRRLLYVAVSRARHCVVFFGELPNEHGITFTN